MQPTNNHQLFFNCVSIMSLSKVQIDETQIQQRSIGSINDTVWDHHAKETDRNKMTKKEKFIFLTKTFTTNSINQAMWLYIVQLAAFLFSKTSTDPTSSIVRGRSLKSGLTTPLATTGLETTCSVDWHSVVATNWDLSCRHVTTPAGTGPNTAGSLFSESHATTRFRCLATRVTPATMHLVGTTEWCSPRTTEITTGGPAAATTTTVQCTPAGDSGTSGATSAASTLSVVVEMTSNGTKHCCVHLACGSRARSLHRLRASTITIERKTNRTETVLSC